jgi:hypothetical protein
MYLHYGDAIDIGNIGKDEVQNRRQPNEDGRKSRKNDHKS